MHSHDYGETWHCPPCRDQDRAEKQAVLDQHAAEQLALYRQLPEVSRSLLTSWLTGEVAEDEFVDGKTHQSTSWTCRAVAELLVDEGLMGAELCLRSTYALTLTADGTIIRKVPGSDDGDRLGSGRWEPAKISPDAPFYEASPSLANELDHNPRRGFALLYTPMTRSDRRRSTGNSRGQHGTRHRAMAEWWSVARLAMYLAAIAALLYIVTR